MQRWYWTAVVRNATDCTAGRVWFAEPKRYLAAGIRARQQSEDAEEAG
jgi:hypothetical protein